MHCTLFNCAFIIPYININNKLDELGFKIIFFCSTTQSYINHMLSNALLYKDKLDVWTKPTCKDNWCTETVAHIDSQVYCILLNI